MAVTVGAAALRAPHLGGRADHWGAVVADHLGTLPAAGAVPGSEPPHDGAHTAAAAMARPVRPGDGGIGGCGAVVRRGLSPATSRQSGRIAGDDLEHRITERESGRSIGSDETGGARRP